MFKSLRWRLTGWFVLLSAIVYVFLSMAALGLFQVGLTEALNQELTDLSAEVLPEIDYSDSKLTFSGWTARTSKRSRKHPSRLLVAIQLYDAQGKLLQEE